MIYGLMAAWGAALLSLVWGLYQRRQATAYAALLAQAHQERNDARGEKELAHLYWQTQVAENERLVQRGETIKAQRDRLNRENDDLHEINAQMHSAANEFQAVLTKTELGYLAQLNERDEALVAMRLQLDEALKPRRRSKGQPVTTEVAE